jgi:hypothetical protein
MYTTSKPLFCPSPGFNNDYGYAALMFNPNNLSISE